MGTQSFEKDPLAVLDYSVDWRDADDPWLEDDETITESTWIVPDGITQDSESKLDGLCTIWLSGCTAGTSYTVRNHIVTSKGRKETRSVYILGKER